MRKYRIKEITYGNGSKKFKVESQQKYTIGNFITNDFLISILLILISFGIILIVFMLSVLYFSIFPEWKYLQTFDDLHEAQFYIEQEQELDKENFEKEKKEKELKKAQKIVSEKIVKLYEKAF